MLCSVPSLCAHPLNNSAPSRVVSYADASRIVREHADRLAERRGVLRSPLPCSMLWAWCWPSRFLPTAISRRFPAPRAMGLPAGPPMLRPACRLWSLGRSAPARRWRSQVTAGQAVEIMTGAPVPGGADCVVMVEHVQRDRDTLRLTQGRSIAAGDNIVPMGAEARAGEVILPRGTRISAAQVAAAAACGAAQLSVFARPRVAIVATGDELVEVDQRPLIHQIRNSNSYSLAAQILAAGAQPVRLPIARDERGHLEAIIRSALQADLLLLSGGVSMGKYDLVEEVLLSLGAEFFFTGALIQPGKPVVFGRLALEHRQIYFFGLPGNPVSTMVTFSLFVEPLLGALCGDAWPRAPFRAGPPGQRRPVLRLA